MHETIRVKSAAWDDSGVLVYTTLNHIKCGPPPPELLHKGRAVSWQQEQAGLLLGLVAC